LQGLSKLPLDISDAESYGLPMSVWFFVAWGELLSGIGLLVGGLLVSKKLNSYGGLITRFCGIVICGIMTGIILMQEPESFLDVLLYDNLHVMLYCGGLFFALRGNRVYLEDKKE
jgi:putative oxidoreductase